MRGLKSQKVVEYVQANPGCSRFDAAKAVSSTSPSGKLNMAGGYAAVAAAVKRGELRLEEREDRPGAFILFAEEVEVEGEEELAPDSDSDSDEVDDLDLEEAVG